MDLILSRYVNRYICKMVVSDISNGLGAHQRRLQKRYKLNVFKDWNQIGNSLFLNNVCWLIMILNSFNIYSINHLFQLNPQKIIQRTQIFNLFYATAIEFLEIILTSSIPISWTCSIKCNPFQVFRIFTEQQAH